MENLEDEFTYWDPMQATMMLPNELEFDCWPREEAFSGSGESSSPDGAATSPASKNVLSERNRRHRLNQRLLDLRSVVPNISKLDKASVIKDSIDYIQELQKQEKRLEAEIRELESRSSLKNINVSEGGYDCLNFDQELPDVLGSKHQIRQMDYNSFELRQHSPIEVLEMKVMCALEKIAVVIITCSKKTDTLVKLCQVLESLNLKVLTANITSVSARLSMNIFLEADEDEIALLEGRIQGAISTFNDFQIPMDLY